MHQQKGRQQWQQSQPTRQEIETTEQLTDALVTPAPAQDAMFPQQVSNIEMLGPVHKVTLVEALAKAQAEFPEIKKDRENDFYKSKYATLDSVIKATREPLCKNGIAVTHTFAKEESGPVVITTLHHISGETMRSVIPIIAGDGMQGLGSAITYAKRYNLCGLLNVTANEDDDGNAAQPNKQQPRRQRPANTQRSKQTTKKETKEELAKNLVARARKSYQAADGYEAVLEALQKVGEYRDSFPTLTSYCDALNCLFDDVALTFTEGEQGELLNRVEWFISSHPEVKEKEELTKKLEAEADEAFGV